eukprot:3118528-Prymnesium_polylepis.1
MARGTASARARACDSSDEGSGQCEKRDVSAAGSAPCTARAGAKPSTGVCLWPKARASAQPAHRW